MAGKTDSGAGTSAYFQTLRKRAEEELIVNDKFLKDMSASEMSRLIHELLIHQVELEMQNEGLRKSRTDTEASSKAFQDLWELSPAGYLIVDSAGRVTAVNRAAQRLFGRPESALLNERFSMLVISENRTPVHLMFERAVETGLAERQEIRILRPDGSIRICLLEVRSLGGAPGREQTQAVLTDITKQKQAEDELRKNEQEKVDILDSLMEHVIYHDRKMKIMWANRAACESVHMKREDLLDRKCHEVWADRPDPCEDCPVLKARDTGQPQMAEKMTPDGRWWYIQGHPVRDKNGQVTGVTELTLDITGRKHAEEIIRKAENELEIKVEECTAELMAANRKLRQEIEVRNKAQKELQANERMLSTMFAAIQDLLVVIDKDLQVVMSNWKDHDYISETDRQGRPFCYEVFMKRKKPCNPCPATEVFTTGELRQLEGTNPIDGKIRDIRVLPMFDHKGNVVAVIEHIRDISDQKKAEDHIHTLSRQLMQAQEGERQMLSRELHDTVAQDLSVAKMECDLIYGELSNNRAPEAQRVQEISGVLQKTIRAVRNMSYELRPPGLEEQGLVETIYQFCEDFTQMWGVPVDFQSAGLKNLKLDSNMEINLYRLVQEGLTNIRKHAAAGRATVKLAAAFPNIILRIEDNGRGFDVQQWTSANDHEKRMGLRSMQERVKLMNGEMKLQSKPGQGTKVAVKVPFEEKMSSDQENHLDR